MRDIADLNLSGLYVGFSVCALTNGVKSGKTVRHCLDRYSPELPNHFTAQTDWSAMKQTGSFGTAIFADEAKPVNLDDVLEACDVQQAGKELGSCFGIALDLCLVQFPDNAATPLPCWQNELAVWEQLMTQSYDALLVDLENRDYAAFKEQLNAAQALWATQSPLDCELEVMSSPPTQETIGTACMARKFMDRTLFLRDLFGAHWTAGD